MAAGLETFFAAVKGQLTSKSDTIVAAVHWFIIQRGKECVGTGDTWPESCTEKRSELLPQGWNSSQEVYSLRYVTKNGQRFLAKFVKSDQSILISLVNVDAEKASGMSVNINDHVADSFDEFENAYKQIEEVKKNVERLMSEVESDNTAEKQRPASPRHDSYYEHSTDPLRVPGFGRSELYDNRSGNPFSVGRGDLDPLGQSEGGMLMDPRNFPNIGVGTSQGGIPRLPRGAVPPGARFDPIGPGQPPRFFGPDNDHFQPPGFFDDRFL